MFQRFLRTRGGGQRNNAGKKMRAASVQKGHYPPALYSKAWNIGTNTINILIIIIIINIYIYMNQSLTLTAPHHIYKVP